MSSEHKRPLYAFLVLTIVCGVFMGYSLKAEALRGILTDGASSLASRVIHVAPVIRLVEPDRAASNDVRRDSASVTVPTPAPTPVPRTVHAVEQPSGLKPTGLAGAPAAPPAIEAKPEDARAKSGKKARGHKHAKHGEKDTKPGKKAKHKKSGKKNSGKKKSGQRR